MKNLNYAILTAQNPYGVYSNKNYNEEQNQRLIEDLDKLNLKYIEVKGSYGGVKETSFIVYNIRLDIAIGIGKKYRQESILIPQGLLYVKDLTLNPSTNFGSFEIVGEEEQDNFSELNGLKFRCPIDFSRKVDANKILLS